MVFPLVTCLTCLGLSFLTYKKGRLAYNILKALLALRLGFYQLLNLET